MFDRRTLLKTSALGAAVATLPAARGLSSRGHERGPDGGSERMPSLDLASHLDFLQGVMLFHDIPSAVMRGPIRSGHQRRRGTRAGVDIRAELEKAGLIVTGEPGRGRISTGAKPV